jgi:hypothetical protein
MDVPKIEREFRRILKSRKSMPQREVMAERLFQKINEFHASLADDRARSQFRADYRALAEVKLVTPSSSTADQAPLVERPRQEVERDRGDTRKAKPRTWGFLRTEQTRDGAPLSSGSFQTVCICQTIIYCAQAYKIFLCCPSRTNKIALDVLIASLAGDR